MRAETSNWLKSAEYDIETARFMLSSERYIYVVFLCHLAIEKMLKAIVCETHGMSPPRTHNLIYLANHAKMQFDPIHNQFISMLNNVSIPTRYPADMQKTLLEYTREVVSSYLKQTEEVVKWLKSQPKLRE